MLVQFPAAVIFVPAVSVPALNNVLPLMSRLAGAVKLPLVIVRSFVTMVVGLAPVANAPPPLVTVRLLNVRLAALFVIV